MKRADGRSDVADLVYETWSQRAAEGYDKVHDVSSRRAATAVNGPVLWSYRIRGFSNTDRWVSPYPVGRGKVLSYGGGHTFGLTRRGAKKEEALSVASHHFV